jgi:hypothetical protein
MEDIKHKLTAYWYCVSHLDDLDNRYRVLKAKAEKDTSSLSLAPASGGRQDKMAETATLLADIDREKQKERSMLLSNEKDVQAIISMLSDYKMRLIMEDRYLNLVYDGGCARMMHWEEIAVSRHYSYRYVIMLHGEALKILSKL